MKLLLRVAIVGLLLVVLLIGGALFFAPNLVKAGIEQGGTYALGVETHVARVDLGLTSGELVLNDFSVRNPPGFEREHFLRLGRGEVAVSLASLRGDRVEAPRLVIDGLTLDLERRNGKTNYGTILDHLEQLQPAEGGPPPTPKEEQPGGGKTFLIHEILIRDVTAHVDLLPEGGELTKAKVVLPELRLESVGDTGETLPELIARLTTAVLQASAGSLEGVIPAELLAQLQGDLADLDQVGVVLEGKARAVVDEKMKELQEQMDQELEGLGEEANEALKKGLGDLLKKD